MRGNCHLLFGTAIGSMCALNTEYISNYFPAIENTPETMALFVLGGIVGSVLPDIDNQSSYVAKLCYPLGKPFYALQKMQNKQEWQHRGIMHDFGIYLIGLILSVNYFPCLVGLFLGLISHIFLDMFNPMGVPFLFGIKHIHLGKIKSSDDKAVKFCIMLTVIVCILGIGIFFYFKSSSPAPIPDDWVRIG